MKLKLSFHEFIGARLGIPGQKSAPRKPHPASPAKSMALARKLALSYYDNHSVDELEKRYPR